MFNNSADMAYASKRIKGSKWLLLLCAGSSAAVDILIISLLFLGGVGAEYFVCPFLLLAFDIIYFVISLFFTNFRFKYSIITWVSYIVLFTIGMAVGSAILFAGSGTVLTNGAIGLWVGVHAFSIICAVITALFASRTMKNKWVALALTAVYIIGCAFYAGYMFTEGFFGQGFGRALIYKLNEDGESYGVYDALTGRNTQVEIPEEFNGKPVTAVNLNLFMNPSVTEIRMHDDLEFTASEVLAQTMDLSGKVVSVDKDAVNAVREKLYAFTGTGDSVKNAVTLANAVRPAALDEGEGYVTFTYDEVYYNACGGKVMPAYIGKLADFDFNGYAAQFGYVAHRNDGSVENLDWAFNNGGYIFTDAAGESGSVADGKVSANTVAQIKYEKVYRLEVESGNDTKYDLRENQPEVCFDELGGQRLNFRYVTEKTCDGVINEVEERKGFVLNWRYGGKGVQDAQLFGNLSSFIAGTGLTDLTATPVWALKSPTVKLSTSAANNIITYGESVTVYSGAEIEAEGVTLKYSWTVNDGTQTAYSTKDVSLDAPKTEKSGKYSVIVTVDGGETTSLAGTAFATGNINLTINRKKVAFDWTVPLELQYDGEEKTVSVGFDREQLVGDDDFRYYLVGGANNQYTIKNAKAYTLSVMVSLGEEDYEVLNKSKAVVITPRPALVTWSGYENLEYNGSVQSPAAAATGVDKDGAITVAVQGGMKNAGENYTATAVTANSNYTLTNATMKYGIAKKPLTATPADVSTIYGTLPSQAPQISYDGFVSGDGATAIGGSPIFGYLPDFNDADYKVGTYPGGVTLSGLSSVNYDITFGTSTLEITPRQLRLVWDTQNFGDLVYNGKPQNVYPTVENTIKNDDVRVLVEGGDEINAGSHVAVVTGKTGAAADNYELRAEEFHYVISRAPLKIKANGGVSTYGDDYSEKLTATIEGEIYNDEIRYVINGPFSNNAGTYDITVTVEDGPQNGNYQIQTVKGSHRIERRVAYVRWYSTKTYYYDGTEKGVFSSEGSATSLYVGFLEEDWPLVSVVNCRATEVGKYTARVLMESKIIGNYDVAARECEWEIKEPDLETYVYIENQFKYSTTVGGVVLTATAEEMISFYVYYGHNSSKSPEVSIAVTKDCEPDQMFTSNKYVFKEAGTYEFRITSTDKYLVGVEIVIMVKVTD